MTYEKLGRAASLGRRLLPYLSVLCLTVLAASAQADLTGHWSPEGRSGVVSIAFADDVGEGRVASADGREEALGRVMLRKLKASGEDRWGGELYVAPLGDFAPVTLNLLEPDRLRMTVRLRMMKRTVYWARVEPAASSADEAVE
ncbi:MAG: hypothetical protein AAF648_12835 [Pseudomonadota bacterium]